MPRAGRINDERAWAGRSVAISLRSREHEDVFVARVLVQSDGSAPTKAQERRRRPRDPVAIEAVNIDFLRWEFGK